MARAVERQLLVALDAQIGAAAMSARLAAASKRALADTIARGQGSPLYETIVNGRTGAREETVVAPGPIVHLFNWWPQVLIYAITFLRNRSPASSPDSPEGRAPYRDRFFVLADGESVNPRAYHTIRPEAEVIIGNSAPYNRKIDVQLIGRKPIKVNVPPGIMEDGAQAISARFPTLLKAKRLYTIEFTGQYIRENRRAGSGQPWQLTTGRTQDGKPVHSPAILITRKVVEI